MILDTNALSAAAELEPEALKAVANADRIFVPVIVLGEYRLGISQSRHHTAYENWLRGWLQDVTVLEVDEATTHSYAEVGLELKKKGKPIPSNDMWIAAICRQYSLPLLSRDRHFDGISGLQRIEW